MHLIERQDERSKLIEAVNAGRLGAGSVVAIEGPPGIGKTRLLTEAGRLASKGIEVLWARGSELEREHAWGICLQLLQPPLQGADPDRREALLSAAGLARELLDPGIEPGEGDRAFGLMNGLFWLIAELSRTTPLLIAVDDLHWADHASLRFLAYLARRLDQVAVTLCVALRPAEPGGERSLIDALTGAAETTWLRPPPLSESGTTELVRSTLGDAAEPDFCAACHRASGGNPLLLRELIRALGAEGVAPAAAQVAVVERIGPAAIARALRQRLAPLPDSHRAFAAAVAVLGEGASEAVAAELAEIAEAEATVALDALCRLEVLAAAPELRFAHPLVREALLADLAPGRRRALHARAVELLAARGARAAEIAGHLRHAPPDGDPDRVSILRSAGNEALGAGDAEAAAAYLRRALDEPPPPELRWELLLELAAAETLLDYESAAAAIEEALPLIDDRVTRATARAQLAALLPSEQPDRAVDVGLAAIDELGEDPPELRSQLHATVLTAALLAPGRVPDELLEPARGADPAAGTGARMLAAALAFARARENVASNELRAAIGAAFPADSTEEVSAIGAQLMLAMPAIVAADTDDALILSEKWAREAERSGSLSAFGGSRATRAHALLGRGRIEEALADASDAAEALESFRLRGIAVGWAYSVLAEAQIERGEPDAAGETLARAHDSTSSVALYGPLATQARLRAIRGDAQGALRDTLELGRRFERLGGRNPGLLPWRSRAALLLCDLGERPEEARHLAEEELSLAREWAAPRAIGRALITAGRARGGGDGLALLERAVVELQAAPSSLERIEALIALGSALRPALGPTAAREPLREALALAKSSGARRLQQRARDELVASGARPRRAAVTGPGSLTARERQVADLVAEGNSNREVGARLHLTTRSVESHLTRIYRKLEITSRSQLADALHEEPVAAGAS